MPLEGVPDLLRRDHEVKPAAGREGRGVKPEVFSGALQRLKMP